MTPAVQKAYNAIHAFIGQQAKPLTQAEYIDLMEEISTTVDGMAEAVRDDVERQQQDALRGDDDDLTPYDKATLENTTEPQDGE